MSCIVLSWFLKLPIIHRISHLVPQELLKKHDYYCYFWQYCYYFSGFRVHFLIFWYHFSRFSFRLLYLHTCSSISLTRRPNFQVVKNHLHKLGLPDDSCTPQLLFRIISFLLLTLAFIPFQTSSVPQEGLIFWASWIRIYWFIVAYGYPIVEHDKSLSLHPYGF